MLQSINELLSQENIRQAKKLVSEYNFFLEKIPVEIRIKIYESITEFEGFSFSQSHYLKTPLQSMRYRTNSFRAASEQDCVRLALNTFLNFYNDAVRVGHEPIAEWLEPNEFY